MIGLFVVITALLGWAAGGLHIDAGFQKLLPLKHPYMATFLKHQQEFGGANRVLVAVMARDGNMFTPQFFESLKNVTDEVFFLPGVDRGRVQSLFTPNVRYTEVVEDGIAAGNVIPDDFEPTPEGLERVRRNILKAGIVGRLVANDFSGAIVSAELMEFDPTTGQRLDFIAVANEIESRVRAKFDADAARPVDVVVEHTPVDIHVVGFSKVIGDIAAGARRVLIFFLITFAIMAVLVRIYSQSARTTVLVLGCAVIAVVWQLGLLTLFGYGMDPMSILVPFLIFAIAVSHGVQMVSSVGSEVFDGADGMAAARASFRRLIVPGGIALATDLIGFFTILFIQIQAIQEIAVAASVGVAAIILTNLVLLPVVISYFHFDERFREKIHRRAKQMARLWRRVAHVTDRGPATAILVVSVLLGVYGYWKGSAVQVGDLHRGVPELHADSRYNTDTAVITSKFSIGVDILNVIAETKPEGCVDHAVMTTIDEFSWRMANLPGVQSTLELASVAKSLNAGWNEGSPKWRVLSRNQSVLTQSVTYVPTSTGLLNSDCSVMPVMVFTRDHKATTIQEIVVRGEGLRGVARERGRVLQAGHRERRRDGRDQRGGGGGPVADHGVRVRRGDPAVPGVVPLGARDAVHPDPTGHRVAAVVRADGPAGDRPEGEHPAGGGAWRGRRGRLRHLPVQPLPQLLPRWRLALRRVLQDPRGHRERGALHRGDAGPRRRDVDVLAAEVPGGHGPAARLPVPDEHGGRAAPAAGPRVLPARRDQAPAGVGGLCQISDGD